MMDKFRFKEWYHSKIIFFVGLFFLLLTVNPWISYSNVHFFDLLFVLTYLLFGASSGYYINDFYDKEKDLKVGKVNFSSKHSLKTSIGILILLKCVLWFNWILLSGNAIVGVLIGFQIMLFYLYAIPKIRLKEHPILGVVTDATYALFVPFSIIYLTVFKEDFNLSLYLLGGAWTFIVGIRGILQHQVEDEVNDLQSETTSTVTHFGLRSVLIVNKIILPIVEFILLSVFLYLTNPAIGIFYYCYLVYISIRQQLYKQIKNKPYIKPRLNILSYYFEEFYNKWLIASVLIVLSVTVSCTYLIFLMLFAILFFNILKSFEIDFNFLNQKMLKPIYYLLFGVLSYLVNNFLYYLFLMFHIDLKERAKLKENNATYFEENTEDEHTQGESTQKIRSSEKILSKIIEANVHGLWIGGKLSNLELLTISSFINNGYIFHLWTYEQIETSLPKEVKLEDANEIIDQSKVFRYQNNSQFNGGQGSVAGFSDIFRYKLLYEKGGWWVDMDVSCLKPFDVKTDYFFRSHHQLKLVGNVMKAPVKSELMKLCYEEAVLSITADNTDWHKPINILVSNVEKLNLAHCIYSNISNSDEFEKLEKYYFGNEIPPNHWRFIHWCNEVIRGFKLNKNQYFYNSYYAQLLQKNELVANLNKEGIINNDNKFRREIILCNLLQAL